MAPRMRSTLLAAVTAALVALPVAAGAAPQTFTPTGDPCLGDPAEAPFADRDRVRRPHGEAVDCAFDSGVLLGKQVNGERVLQPANATTRAQMASIVVRGLEHAGYALPASPGDAFGDDESSVHEDNINKLAAIGVVQGTTSTTYKPLRPVLRDQMTSIMVRAAEWAYGTEFEATAANPFSDVESDNVHRDNIIIGAEVLGLAVGQADGTFQPDALTRRDWVATFIARLIDMTLIDAEDPASDPASGPTVGTSQP